MSVRVEAPRAGRRRREGSALIITIIVLFMLMMLVVGVTGTSMTRSNAVLFSRQRVQLLAACEAGIGFKLNEVAADPENPASLAVRTYDVDGILIVAWGEEVDTDVIRLRAVGRMTQGVDTNGDPVLMLRGVETYLTASTHPLFHKSIYVGNRLNLSGYNFTIGPVDGGIRDPASGKTATEEGTSVSTTKGESFEEGTHDAADYVEGDVFVNGKATIRGTTNMYGDLDVTDHASGRPVEGTTTEGVDNVAPPDLSGMNYAAMADFVVDSTNPSPVDFIKHGVFRSVDNYTGSSDGSYTDYTKNPGNYSNPNFQVGSASGAMADLTMSQIDGTGNQLVYVKGNLWLESFDVKDYVLPSSSAGKKVTIVVEGNMYISDQLSYSDTTKDAIMFIVKGKDDDPNTATREDESFVDGYKTNGSYDQTLINGKWDPGEIVINDSDGDPTTYSGPKEGQGNIYYGDKVQTAGGITDGFMYAQNNAYLLTKNTPNQLYGVRGFLSAGGVLDMGNASVYRGKGSNFVNYRVKGDPRLKDGTITLKGVPAAQGGGNAGLTGTTWREMRRGEWEDTDGAGAGTGDPIYMTWLGTHPYP